MKRGSISKNKSVMLTVWVPKVLLPSLERGVLLEDSDKSKFVRKAIREKLARHGVQMSEEAA